MWVQGVRESTDIKIYIYIYLFIYVFIVIIITTIIMIIIIILFYFFWGGSALLGWDPGFRGLGFRVYGSGYVGYIVHSSCLWPSDLIPEPAYDAT